MAITPQVFAGNLPLSTPTTIYTVPANTIAKIAAFIGQPNASGVIVLTAHVGITDWDIGYLTLTSASVSNVDTDGLFFPAGTIIKAMATVNALSYVLILLELT